jgi:hypothetical protein
MASAEPTYQQPTYQQPTCEDYHSDDSVPFTGRKSPNAANVSTKRSHPSDLDKEKPPAQERMHPNIDLRSDSGYSSYTTATFGSADSAPSATSQHSPPVAPAKTQPVPSQSPAPKTRRPTVSADTRQNSSNSASRPNPLSRTASTSSRPSAGQRRPTITQERNRDRRESKAGECKDPNCTECEPTARPQRRPRELPGPSASARDVTYPSADQRSMRSDPADYTSPPSPTYHRPSVYMRGPTIVEPAPTRRRTSSSARQRPMSYSGEPGSQYPWGSAMPAPYPSPPQDRGPPPSASAYRSIPPYPQMPFMAPHPQTPGYYPPQQPYNQTSPPYEIPSRPALNTRLSSNYGTHNTRNGPAPIITQQPRDPKYSARYPQQPQSATQARFPAPLQLQGEAYKSSDTESSSEEEDQQELDPRDPRHARALMPPPKMKRSKSKKRPSALRAKTTQVVDIDRADRQMDPPERPARERASSRTDNPLSRRMSVGRPAVQRQTQSAYDTPRARVVVNQSAKASRRQSTQVYDKVYEQYAKARALEDAQLRAREEAAARAREEAEARAHQEAQKAQAKAMEERYQAELKRERRNSRVVHAPVPYEDSSSEEESEEEEPTPAPLRRRRPTDVGKSKPRVAETKTKRIESAAEDYISAQRGSRHDYADKIHKVAKRASQMPSGPSHSGSSGSDKQSQSNRTAVTSNGSNEIRLRVDASAPLSLSFNGDMEGRTLQLVPVGDGKADIVISGGQGEGTAYHGSERGSVRGNNRKSFIGSQARRDAEEMTERSSSSRRSRRDGREVRQSREIRDDWDSRGPPVIRRHTEYHA